MIEGVRDAKGGQVQTRRFAAPGCLQHILGGQRSRSPVA
jgi:hypothetical protein